MDDRTAKVLDVLQNDGRRLFALLSRLTMREDVADDLLQDLFLRLQKSESFDKAKNPNAYATTSAVHLAYDWRRKQKDNTSLLIDPAIEVSSDRLLNQLEQAEEYERVVDAISLLGDTVRNVVTLHYLDHQEYSTIAESIEKTPHQVRALCSKGISQLRKQLASSSPQES